MDRTTTSSSKVSKPCLNCGGLFESWTYKDRRYCRVECWRASQRVTRLCAECGETFTRKKSRTKDYRRTGAYCSVQCANRALHRTRRETGGKTVTQLCPVCGTPYTFYKCWPVETCSIRCGNIHSGKLQRMGERQRPSTLERMVARELARLGQRYEQHKWIGPYCVDFYLPDRRMILEADGTYWHSRADMRARDIERDAFHRAHRFHVIRLGESTIKHDAAGAVERTLSRHQVTAD